jgi:hypothetical protein
MAAACSGNSRPASGDGVHRPRSPSSRVKADARAAASAKAIVEDEGGDGLSRTNLGLNIHVGLAVKCTKMNVPTSARTDPGVSGSLIGFPSMRIQFGAARHPHLM